MQSPLKLGGFEELRKQKTCRGIGLGVENLAIELHKEFPGMQDFSAANLWRMRSFYTNYHLHVKLAPMVREIASRSRPAITTAVVASALPSDFDEYF